MPIPVKSRRYDKLFWDEMKGRSVERTLVDINDDLFG